MSSRIVRGAVAPVVGATLGVMLALLAAGCGTASSRPGRAWSLTGVGITDRTASTPRRVIDLDDGWRFVRADCLGAERPNFDDSHWQRVSLPHTWNNLDGQDGGDNYYRGAGWYRLHLRPGSAARGKSLFLKFDAASSVAQVFVNGRLAGTHKGMFAAFCFDVTPLINVDGDNVIAVRVDNAPRPDVPPLSADFTFFGGLYRRAHLLVLDPLCISPVDDASSGLYVKQVHVTPDAADLQVTAKLLGASTAARNGYARVELLDSAGKPVIDRAVALSGLLGHTDEPQAQITLPIHLDHPHLWNGRKDPYLYQLRVTLADGSRITDEVAQPIGLRFFHVDPDRGFFLNGVSYPLHGVNRHQDRIDMGWAITPAQHKQDFDLIMEMGCTGIRLAHYQHAQDFYDLCDRGGLVVWAEACLVNKVTDSPQFDATAMQQLRELIKQNYNHPSICFWSVFNELGNGNNGTAAQRAAQTRHQIVLVRKLSDEAHQLDDTRPTTGASNRPDAANPLNKITDIIGINRYNGWYTDNPGSWPHALDLLRQGLPGRCIGISEYGAGASIYQHEENPPQPKTAGWWHPEEYQCTVHEAAWAAMKDRPWLWGTFLWNMFDFASDGRHEGDHPGRNDKGLVTYDRKTKKDAFYFYKANWSDESVVYITDRRFTPRPQIGGGVKVYSNCDSVELAVNGTSLGSKTGSDIHVFLWPDAQLKPGKNEIVAIGKRGGRTFTDHCTIVVDPTLRITPPTTQPYYVP